jgi:tRNA A37 threonylcarbamoyladenosine dehydratase
LENRSFYILAQPRGLEFSVNSSQPDKSPSIPPDAETERRFGGVARLYGERGLARFRGAHICVIGVGGVGSWAVEALARSAIGRLTLIDLDHVSESNINRQLPALSETLGAAKVQVLADRIHQINPDCRTVTIEDFVAVDNLDQLLPPDCDWVLDCIDSFRTKAALLAHCRRRRIPVIASGSSGGKQEPCRIRVSDLSRTEQDPLLAKTRRLLRQEYGFPRDPRRRFEVAAVWSDEPVRQPGGDRCDSSLNCGGFGSTMAVTASFGLAAAAHVLQRLSSAPTPHNED